MRGSKEEERKVGRRVARKAYLMRGKENGEEKRGKCSLELR